MINLTDEMVARLDSALADRIFLLGGHVLQGRRTPDKPQGKRDGLRQRYAGLLGAGQAVGLGQRCRESAGRRLQRPRRRPFAVAAPRARQPSTKRVPFAKKSWIAASKPNWTGTRNVWVSPS